MSDTERMAVLVQELNAATIAYESGNPTMTDKEWDEKYFELKALEDKENLIFINSPTNSIQFIKVSELSKVTHDHDMLSLDKTKDIKAVVDFVGSHSVVAMAKMDGLTCSLTYRNGLLVGAETRGNGFVGEDVLHNIMEIENIPRSIPLDSGKVVIDGQVIMTYKALEYWNDNHKQQYSNPRNTAAGAVRRLDARESAQFHLSFVAWELVSGLEKENGFINRLAMLGEMGFDVAPAILIHENITEENCDNIVNKIKEAAEKHSYPIDGCVFKFNDIAYGESLGATAHHKNNAIAFKFYDDIYESTLLDIDWTMGRTGILTPVAKFEPVEIDGTIVERASLHNLSILVSTFNGITPVIGDKVNIFKANMIIPQIASAANVGLGNSLPVPNKCPYCGADTEIVKHEDTNDVMCPNAECQGKIINKMTHFCGKKGMDIKGLSTATIEKLIDWGFIENLSDIYTLSDYKNEWIDKPGFGPASVNKILMAIDESKNRSLDKFICALGIPLVGPSVAKVICKHVDNWDNFINKVKYLNFDFTLIGSIGQAIENNIKNYDYSVAIEIAKHLNLENKRTDELTESHKNLDGLTFVITGKINLWKNRDQLSANIAELGGKVSSTVSSKTSYLIANAEEDTTKYKKAISLNIPIITEVQFIELIKENSSNG